MADELSIGQLTSLVNYLTGEKRAVLDALDRAAELGGIRPDPESPDGVRVILAETTERVRTLVRFGGIAFFLVDEEDADLHLAYCDPPEVEAEAEAELAALIDDQTLSWTLARSKPVMVRGKGNGTQLLLHAVSTASRTRGLFLGVMDQDRKEILDMSYSLLSFMLFSCANSLEGHELYHYIHSINRELKQNVDKLEESEIKLLAYQQELERLVEERTRDLRAERDFIAATLDTAGALIVVLDAEGRIVRFNKACERLTGFTAKEVLGKTVVELFVVPEELAEVGPVLRRLQAGEQGVQCDNHWQDREGRKFLISWSNAAILDAHGAVTFIISAGIDITERKQAEERLAQAEATYRTIFENAMEGIFQARPRGSFITANPAMAAMFGYDSPEELIGKVEDGCALLCPERAECERFLQTLIAEGRVTNLEFETRRRDGRPMWISVSARAVMEPDGSVRHIEGLAEDVTERKLSEFSLREQAAIDPLTKIPNRHEFEGRFEQMLAQIQRHGGLGALLYVDLDKFKPINDTYGHHVGDALLKEVANRLAARVRRSDLLARIGGDEFAVLLTNLSHADDAMRVAQQIVESITRPYQAEGIECVVGVSIGVAMIPEDGLVSSDLLRKADAAMYRAKQAGGNSYRA